MYRVFRHFSNAQVLETEKETLEEALSYCRECTLSDDNGYVLSIRKDDRTIYEISCHNNVALNIDCCATKEELAQIRKYVIENGLHWDYALDKYIKESLTDHTVSVIRCGKRKISEVGVLTIQAGDVFFAENAHDSQYAHKAARAIATQGTYAWMVFEEESSGWWDCMELLSNVKPYVVTRDDKPYAIPSAEHIDINPVTQTVLGLKAAREAAEKDGIRFINDIRTIPMKFYIDTEENRRIIASYLQNRNRVPGFSNLVVYTDGNYIYDLSFWGAGIMDELWNPHKKEYIPKEELPAPLLKAYENLWERTGDDYLVEYFGKYYLMLDHVYHGDRVNDYGAETMAELFDIALYNAKTVCVQDALKECIVLVSKSCKENGNMHFVSVLVDAETAKEKVDQIKGVLQQHMFQKQERGHDQTLGERIESAAVRAAEGGGSNKTKEKESLISL